MMVTLNERGTGQFGENGPQQGDSGIAVKIMNDRDEDIYVVVLFEKHYGFYNVPLWYLLHADTSNAETVWSTSL